MGSSQLRVDSGLRHFSTNPFGGGIDCHQLVLRQDSSVLVQGIDIRMLSDVLMPGALADRAAESLLAFRNDRRNKPAHETAAVY